MTVQQAPAGLQCRYRLATGCTAAVGADQKSALNNHEKTNSVHALHRVTLRRCPECGKDFGGEQGRAVHLAGEHGIKAGSERRSELDARQVKELYDAQYADETVAKITDADVEEHLSRVTLAAGFEPAPASLNGHSPALDLSAARDMFAAFAVAAERLLAAFVGEVERLRSVVEDLEPDAARYRQIKSITARD